MVNNFLNCTAIVYNDKGGLLANTKVVMHDVQNNLVELQGLPDFTGDKRCTLLIFSTPSPFFYNGTMYMDGRSKLVKLYNEKKADKRKEPRFNIDLPAKIENLIYDGIKYPLHTPLDIRLVDISKNGMRFRSVFNALSKGDIFQMRMGNASSDIILIARIINRTDVTPENSEFRCFFMGRGD